MNDGSDYLDYYLFIPENAVENMPLIIFLHGIGEVGQVDLLEDHGMIKKAKEIYGDSFPFIALSPCTNTTSWTKYAVPDTLKALIDDIAVKCKIDPDRIIITGHSLGAIGTWNMVSLYGDFFSAAVPISCGIDQPMDYANCANVPIWAFAGTVGEYEVNYNNAMHHIVDRIVSYGGNVRITVLSGADHEMTLLAPYTPEFFQWMLEQ